MRTEIMAQAYTWPLADLAHELPNFAQKQGFDLLEHLLLRDFLPLALRDDAFCDEFGRVPGALLGGSPSLKPRRAWAAVWSFRPAMPPWR
jgi:hypothetical protein